MDRLTASLESLASWWAERPALVRRGAGVAGGVAGVAGGVWATSAAAAVFAVAACCLALGAFQLINSVFRVRAEHWARGVGADPSSGGTLRMLLIGELFWGALVMFGVAAGCLTAPAKWWTVLLETAALAIAWILYVDIEHEIRKRIDLDPTLEQGTLRAGRLRPFRWVLGSDRTLLEASKLDHGPYRIAGRLFEVEASADVSPTRNAVTRIIATLTCTGLAISLLLAVGPGSPPGGVADRASAKQISDEGAKGGKRDTHGDAKSSSTQSATNRDGSAKAKTSQREMAWLDVCPDLPGAESSDPTTRGEFTSLYYGEPTVAPHTDDPPGAPQGGCTGAIFVPIGQTADLFQYVIGTSRDGTERSLASISKKFGLAIFLAPALTPLKALIARYLDIGGLRRTNVGNGDVYGVQTPEGTAVLLRPTKTEPGSLLATAYVTLWPAPAKLWLSLMRSEHRMLWAFTQGARVIRLTTDGLGLHTVHRLTTDRAHAVVSLDGQPIIGGTAGIAMSQETLQEVQAGLPPPTRTPAGTSASGHGSVAQPTP